MLSRLYIDNYALIDNTEINFEKGFTVVTGETGAGKSIMLDALSLLMGARADSKVMGTKERKTIAEALFHNPDPSLQKEFENNGLDWDDSEIILRREISPGGKSRAFINDSPVTLTLLQSIANRLLDIHTQHANSILNDEHQQLALIDAYGDTEPVLKKYREVFRSYVELRNKIKRVREQIEKGKANKEFINYRLEQLEKLKPRKGELNELEREYELLGDADKIKGDLTEAHSLMADGSGSALRTLQNVAGILSDLDMEILDREGNDQLMERLENLRIELRDIADTVEEYADNINSDPVRFEKIKERIDDYYDTMKRLKVKDVDELLSLYSQLKEELALQNIQHEDLPLMENTLKEMAHKLKSDAEKLTEERKKSASKFEEEIVAKIKPLGLPNLQFKVEMQKGKLSSSGQDEVTFYCSFNKNHPMQPLNKIASGGEISRVMLGIKSVMARKINLPTIIFDEIDTGVSGEIAHKMGEMMRDMSKNLQVMAVTHLPQVASNGNSHLHVYKTDVEDKTVSRVRKIEGEERIREIAGMLSGDEINEASLENARMLLKSM